MPATCKSKTKKNPPTPRQTLVETVSDVVDSLLSFTPSADTKKKSPARQSKKMARAEKMGQPCLPGLPSEKAGSFTEELRHAVEARSKRVSASADPFVAQPQPGPSMILTKRRRDEDPDVSETEKAAPQQKKRKPRSKVADEPKFIHNKQRRNEIQSKRLFGLRRKVC